MKYQNLSKTLVIVILLVMFLACGSKQKKEQDGKEQAPQKNGQQDQRPEQGRPSVSDIFAELDSNQDGKLSESEVKGPLANDFSAIDSNSDGYLEKEELKNAPRREGNQSQEGRPPRNDKQLPTIAKAISKEIKAINGK